MVFLEEKLYTSEETASILGISLRTLYRYLKKGEIEAETKTQSGTFRFTRKQIYKYLYPDRYTSILDTLKNSQNKNQDKIAYIDEDETQTKNIPLSEEKSDVALTKEPDLGFKNPLGQNTPVLDLPGGDKAPLLEEKKVIEEPAETFKNNQDADSGVNLQTSTTDDLPLNTSKPFSEDEVKKINEQRDNVDLDDELASLENLLDVNKPNTQNDISSNQEQNNNPSSQPNIGVDVASVPNFSPAPSSDLSNQKDPQNTAVSPSSTTTTTPLEELIKPPILSNNDTQNSMGLDKPKENAETWKYFINSNKDILDLAREISSISSETGRKYAATMRGGLSLHHDIDEFNVVHFYVSADDFNWYVSELGLQPASENDANICLIATSDNSIFEESYKLRGLQVVSDSRLIQDLMAHGEKDLAKTLL